MTIMIGVANGFFWIAYGFMKLDPFLYVTNTILFIATATLAVMKKKFDNA